MSEKDRDRDLKKEIERSARRRKARRDEHSVISWLAAYGIVGWSVAIPTLIGVAIGACIDSRVDGSVSWTLTLLFVGLVVGIAVAWSWIDREGRGKR